MSKCNDKLVTLLDNYGYLTVKLPRTGIKPMNVLALSGGELSYRGEIGSLYKPGATPLPATESAVVSKFNHQSTGEIDASLSLSFLKSVLEKLGGTKAGIEATFKSSRKFTFSFHDPEEEKVDIIQLSNALSDSAVINPGLWMPQLEGGNIYLITAILKSNQITVNATTDSGSSLKVDADAIKQVIGGKIDVSRDHEKEDALSFEGEEKLVFGFKAIRLNYKNGVFQMPKEVKSGVMKAVEDEMGLLELEDSVVEI